MKNLIYIPSTLIISWVLLQSTEISLLLTSNTQAASSFPFRDICFSTDEVLLKDVITPGSELLERMADKLDREEVPGVKNWTHLACKLNVPADVRREFGVAGQKRKSPTKEVLEWVAANFPDKTLSDVANALDKIQRNDAIQIISKQFPDVVGK